MLSICDLVVAVKGKTIVDGISLEVPEGQIQVLLGPNGSGKSSLLAAIMGLPSYQVVSGEICFDGQLIHKLDASERAALGIGLAFQRPPSLDGVTLRSFAAALGSAERLKAEADALDLGEFLHRDMNVGFSGGEIKRWEVLKLVLQDPRLLLFDEPESGVDLQHVAAVGAAIGRLMQAPDRAGRRRSGLVITHTGIILDHVRADRAYIMRDGRIVHCGDPRAVLGHIRAHGYSAPAD